MMLVFKKSYFILALLLILIECVIAVFAHDGFIRPYIGDLLVVILLYCLIRSFFEIPVSTACIVVLLFSFLVELLQYFHIVTLLGLQHSSIARIIIGSSFEWLDLVAYTCGIAIVYGVENSHPAKTGLHAD